jgi:hypothetical protein
VLIFAGRLLASHRQAAFCMRWRVIRDCRETTVPGGYFLIDLRRAWS